MQAEKDSGGKEAAVEIDFSERDRDAERREFDLVAGLLEESRGPDATVHSAV